MNCLISDLYGHLHGFIIIVHPNKLPFVDFPKCTMTQSPGNTRVSLCVKHKTININVASLDMENFNCSFSKYLRVVGVCSAVPEKCYVLAWDFFQVIEWRRLPREAVVGVVVRHDGGGANLAQFVLGAVQASPDRVQVILPAIPHWTQTQLRIMTSKLMFTFFTYN